MCIRDRYILQDGGGGEGGRSQGTTVRYCYNAIATMPLCYYALLLGTLPTVHLASRGAKNEQAFAGGV